MIKNILIVALIALTAWGCSNKANVDHASSENDADVLAKDVQVGNEDEVEMSAGHPIPLPKIWLEPGDLVTKSDEKTLQIVVTTANPPLAPALLEAVQSAIRLTDIQSSPIRFTTLVRQDERFGEYGSIIQVIPDELLKEGWHVLSLASFPEGIEKPTGQNEDGTLSIRFRTDSFPILRGVRVSSDEELAKVILEFSENVKMNDALEKSAGLTPPDPNNPCENLTFWGDHITCTRVDGTEEILDMSDRKKMADALEKLVKVTSSERDMACQPTMRLIPDNMVSGEVLGVYDFDWLHLTCVPASDQDKITVEMSPGLVSLEGIELKGPLVHQFVVGEVEKREPGNRFYRALIVE
ncbi:MAG: hypothetical protein FWC40_04900 [Proteobacteria bacterium]|nr:hypothetical protein [Pseudomonadota bacterium]